MRKAITDQENNTIHIRSEISSAVSTLKPFDIIEKEHIDFVLQWINSGVEIFRTEKPAVPDIHLVSYFVVVSAELDQLLLVDHKKAELWLPPGGHVEPGENPKDTVRREAKEELGIEAEFLCESPIFLTVTKTVGNTTIHTDVSLWYILKGNPSMPLDYDVEEFNKIHWFKIDEIPFQKSDPHIRRFIEKMFRENYGCNSKSC